MNTIAVEGLSSLKCPDLGVTFFTSNPGAKCWQILRRVRYALPVMKIKLSNPKVTAPSVGGVFLPLDNSSYVWHMCVKSLAQSLSKVINTTLTQQPCKFGEYHTGNASVPVSVKWQEDNGNIITHQVMVDVSLELYVQIPSNVLKCQISVDGKCYGRMHFYAKVTK